MENSLLVKQQIRRLCVALIIILAIFFEATFAYYFVYNLHLEKVNLVKAIVFHIISSLLILFIPFCYPSESNQRRSINYSAHLSGYLILFFPIIGLIGSGSSLLFAKKILKKKGLADESSDLSKLKGRKGFNQIHNSDEMLKKELKIQPFQDILNGDNIDLKRGAIQYLEKVASPEAVRLIKKCLTFNNQEVRFYAHSSLVKLDKSYTDRIKMLKDKIEERKNDSDLLKQLASIYIKYAESEILEEGTKRYYLKLAKEIFESLLLNDADNIEFLTVVGKLNIFEKQYAQAETIFQKAMLFEPNNTIPVLSLIQIYYEKNDLKSLAIYAQILKKMEITETDHIDQNILLRFWGRE